METRIKDIVIRSGADLCGIANIDRFSEAPSRFHPTDIYPDCRSVIVFAKYLPKGLKYSSPRLTYTKVLQTSLEQLDQISYISALELEKINKGVIVVPLPSDTPYDYWVDFNQIGKGILSIRHAALLAGWEAWAKHSYYYQKIWVI